MRHKKTLVTLATSALLSSQSLLSASTKPNIVFIFADDMGYGDVSGLNSHSKIQTPNIDRLIHEGMYFSDAHTSSSVCTPSRYSLMTGRYCWRTTLKSRVLNGYQRALIPSDRMTLPSMLRDNGYRTAMIGKWHLGMNFKLQRSVSKSNNRKIQPQDVDFSGRVDGGPADVGFDTFYGMSASLDFPPYVFINQDRFEVMPTKEYQSWRADPANTFGRAGFADPDLVAQDVMPRLTRRTVDYIESYKDDKPFFLYMPLTAPHTPIAPNGRFVGKSGLNEYGDFCLEVDDTVGQVLDALDRKGIRDNTIVIFSADNGCSNAANFPEMEKKGHHPSYIYRGSKADIWEGGHRVPMLVRWPEKIKAGTSSDSMIGLTDMLATFSELVGQKLPDNAGEDSESFLQVLLGQRWNPKREGIVNHTVFGYFAIRTKNWKLIFCPGSGGWTAPKDKQARELGLPEIQLYNMATDPGETNNLYGKYPEIESKLTELITQYVLNGRSTEGAAQKNDTSNDWAQLVWINQAAGRAE
ncbi:sulfatase family protein [Poriferisphaera sp. WC338]|uniref:sulfatase family protein n=1 Tax=Poriferisphaera sp. WC338 TaxID=3425129 RepID=UPI003D815FD1